MRRTVPAIREGGRTTRPLPLPGNPGRERLWRARQVTSTRAPPSGMKRIRRLIPLKTENRSRNLFALEPLGFARGGRRAFSVFQNKRKGSWGACGWARMESAGTSGGTSGGRRRRPSTRKRRGRSEAARSHCRDAVGRLYSGGRSGRPVPGGVTSTTIGILGGLTKGGSRGQAPLGREARLRYHTQRCSDPLRRARA